ncbi:AfsR/SARP family transcriptional regulator [Streptomyces iconiensis]|uniref:BTAD domain-containing putative transcriptional regulator n=1 Tax=Streptomyces iconiensis TaxID=1384038 RepID=A0ABT6ZNP9_9ACTN|nr:AfsR/SARP family transcriptional regulator [Streptomyces iconiensis]MDJ1130684.1 BTAD domain-containing putative transcriptional regulator [Streptomyces iconiensis]
MRLELLGSVRAWYEGEEIHIGPPKQRAVVGVLASRVNEIVGVEEIVDAVWGSAVPQTAANGVHTYVAGLRRVLEPGRGRRETGDVLVSSGGGYALCLEPDQVDAILFERHHAEARRLHGQGAHQEALREFDAALGLWRGDAYANVPGPFAEMERTRLGELRLTAVEEWATDMLAVGRHAEVVAVLSPQIAREPLREQLRWLLMLSLYRCGRRAHALGVYRETRRVLNEELGLEPGAELQSLHGRILAGHPDLLPREPETPGAPETGGTGDGWTAVTTRPAPPGPAPAQPLRPAQLPYSARGFVGRTKELASLEALTAQGAGRGEMRPTVAVIDGASGVGKSTFALHAARQLGDRFPDGQLYVDMQGTASRREPLSSPEALAQLLRSLGVEESRLPGDLAGRTALYRSLLHGKRVLLVLDDADCAAQVRPLIPSGPACVLVTSRRRQRGLVVRDGAYRIALQLLSPAESVRLLTYLIGPGRVDGQREAAAQLAEICGRLPLALRIAAESLTEHPRLTLADMVRRHAPEDGRLDRLAVEDDVAASLRAAFAVSYDALPAESARLFRLLGLYHGEMITVSVGAALLGCQPALAQQQLGLLADCHLLEEAGEGRYRFHSLMRIYAAECVEREPATLRSAALARLMAAGSFTPPFDSTPGPQVFRSAAEPFGAVHTRAVSKR